MPTAAEWNECVRGLRACADPMADPAFGVLYRLVRADAPIMARSFKHKFVGDDLVELATDLLVAKLEAIIRADSPRSYFASALVKTLCSFARSPAIRKRNAADDSPGDELRPATGATLNHASEDRAFFIDAARALQALSPRERDVAILIAEGEDREAIAQMFDTSRQNVDQIFSRVRRRFTKEAP